jgi:hypothetical protein
MSSEIQGFRFWIARSQKLVQAERGRGIGETDSFSWQDVAKLGKKQCVSRHDSLIAWKLAPAAKAGGKLGKPIPA